MGACRRCLEPRPGILLDVKRLGRKTRIGGGREKLCILIMWQTLDQRNPITWSAIFMNSAMWRAGGSYDHLSSTRLRTFRRKPGFPRIVRCMRMASSLPVIWGSEFSATIHGKPWCDVRALTHTQNQLSDTPIKFGSRRKVAAGGNIDENQESRKATISRTIACPQILIVDDEQGERLMISD